MTTRMRAAALIATIPLAAGLACPVAGARPAASKKLSDAPGGVRKELVGSWTCSDAWLIERSGGRGPNTLKLKVDGVYVLTARPTGNKHVFRAYGRWGADGKQLYRDTRWYQKDGGKLEPPVRPPSYGGVEYSLSPDGSELTVGDIAFKREAEDGGQAKP